MSTLGSFQTANILPGFTGPIEEVAGSPKINFTRESGDATATFKISWTDIGSFIQLALPDPYVLGGLIVTPPAGTFPGIPWLFASKCAVEPMWDDTIAGDGFFPANYSHAKVTVTYKSEGYDQNERSSGGKPVQTNDGPGGSKGDAHDPNGNPVPFVTHKVHIGGEFIAWPNAGLRWETPSDPNYDATRYPAGPSPLLVGVSDQIHAGIAVPSIEHTLEWHQVAFPPWSAIRACIGKVNAFPFTGAPPETLLFLGAEASREISSSGVRSWTLSYKFSEKNSNAVNPFQPFGWNHFLRHDGLAAGQFSRLRKRPGGGFTYTSEVNSSQPFVQNVISVQSLDGFPTARGNLPDKTQFIVNVNGLIRTVTNITAGGTGSSSTLTLASPAVGTIPKGSTVAQIYISTLAQGITSTSGYFSVADPAAFVTGTGQFYVSVGTELMAVWTVLGQNLAVIRGLDGSIPVSHAQGDPIIQVAGFIYDLTDFSYLFTPGIIIG
jgi:hypothetical protein